MHRGRGGFHPKSLVSVFYVAFLSQWDRSSQKSRDTAEIQMTPIKTAAGTSPVDLSICASSPVTTLYGLFLPSFSFINLEGRPLRGELDSEYGASLLGRRSPIVEHISHATPPTDGLPREKLPGRSTRRSNPI
jgi:hypothetical protein